MVTLLPHTFSRVVHTSLGPKDEHLPLIDDDESELCWPGQFLTGQGMAWLCHMGMSMLR